MELKEAINKRRSIRIFSDKPINKKQIEEIIFSATSAPSACNNQGWRFIIIDSPLIKEKIVAEGGAIFIKDSPVGILVLYDNRTENLEYQDYVQSAAAAIENMLLTATSLEIGSCWICHLPLKRTLRKLLKIPFYFDPIAYIALGYYECGLKLKDAKFQLDEIVSWNVFDFKTTSQSILELKLKRIIRNTYFRLPLFLKKILSPAAERFVKKFE
jgi:hypothetical protein